jgi:TonB family protein
LQHRSCALRIDSIAICAATLALSGPAAFADSATAVPSQQSSLCWIAVGAADPVAADRGAASTYFVNLVPPSGDAKVTISGTIALFTMNERYDITFHDADVRKRTGADYAGTVLAVHFPAPVRIEGAHVSALTAPVSEQCAAASPLLLTLAYKPAVPPAPPEPASVADVSAPEPVHDPLPQCAMPYAEAKTLQVVPVQTPPVSPMDEDRFETWVMVRLAPSGGVISSSIARSSHFLAFDEAVRHAAESARYAPAVFRCATVGSEYKFVGVAEP